MGFLTYVFDASAIMRMLEREAGGARVFTLLKMSRKASCRALISAVNWGEVILTTTRCFGPERVAEADQLRTSGTLQIVPATAERAVQAGLIRLQHGIGYADCFGIELASASPDHILVTADYGAKPTEQDIRIEFLPPKPKPTP